MYTSILKRYGLHLCCNASIREIVLDSGRMNKNIISFILTTYVLNLSATGFLRLLLNVEL